MSRPAIADAATAAPEAAFHAAQARAPVGPSREERQVFVHDVTSCPQVSRDQ